MGVQGLELLLEELLERTKARSLNSEIALRRTEFFFFSKDGRLKRGVDMCCKIILSNLACIRRLSAIRRLLVLVAHIEHEIIRVQLNFGLIFSFLLLFGLPMSPLKLSFRAYGTRLWSLGERFSSAQSVIRGEWSSINMRFSCARAHLFSEELAIDAGKYILFVEVGNEEGFFWRAYSTVLVRVRNGGMKVEARECWPGENLSFVVEIVVF